MFRSVLHTLAEVFGVLLLLALKISGQGAPAGPFRKNEMRNILAIRTDRIGDLVLSTPAFSVLRGQFPSARLSCLVAEGTKAVVEGNPLLNDVLTCGSKLIRRPLQTIRLLRRLRRGNYDAVFVLNYSPSSILLAYLSKAPVRVGTRIPGFGRFLTDGISYKDRDRLGQHETDCILDVLRRAGLAISETPDLFVPVSPEGGEFAARFIESRNLSGKRLVAIHPGSRLPRMRWNRKGFARAADALIRGNSVHILLIQGPGEESLAAEILSLMQEKDVTVAGSLSLQNLIGLLSRSALFIGNSTGTMHLAAALKIPLIVVFGNARPLESPDKWGPRGPGKQAVLNFPLECFESYGSRDSGGEVEEVVAAAGKFLADPSAPV